jgi:hypothetical protein
VRTIRLLANFQPGEEPNVGRMCWIAPDLCDAPLDTDVDGHTVRLRFPEAAPTVYNGWMGDKDNPVGLSPTYFSAELTWDLDTSNADAERDSWQLAVETVRAAATRLTNAIRLAQPTSGLAGDTPTAFEITARDVATGEKVQVPLPLNRSPAMIVGQDVVDRQMVDRALAGQLQIPELLLAQAAYWIRSTPDPRPGLAVVLLAMACETKARRVLTDCAKPDVGPLVTVLFEKGNIFQQSASELFGHISQAIVGHNLRADDRPLFKKVENIFQLRNQMAHRGAEPTRADVAPLVVDAYRVFEWLSQFESDEGTKL